MDRCKVSICVLVLIALITGTMTSAIAHAKLSEPMQAAPMEHVHGASDMDAHTSCKNHCQDHHGCCTLTTPSHVPFAPANMPFPFRLTSASKVVGQFEVEVPPPKSH